MEFEIAKNKSLYYKTALAIHIVCNHPANLSVEQYLNLLTAHFTRDYESNKEKIDQLCMLLLEKKKEVFNLENSLLKTNELTEQTVDDIFSINQSNQTMSLSKMNDNIIDVTSRISYVENMNTQFSSNIEFISNVVKLKSLNKSVKLNESSKETIFECLSILLKHLNMFILGNQDENSDNPANTHEISFPIESILNSAQTFVNVFEIEWLYYLRRNLYTPIIEFIKKLANRIIQHPTNRLIYECDSQKFSSYLQILVILSTSDYLVNDVLLIITNVLQISTDYICQKNSNLFTSSLSMSNSSSLQADSEIDQIFHNSRCLIDCIESIIKLRLLDNITSLSSQLKQSLSQLLNSIFINLADIFPLMSIHLSKLIQLLSLKENA